MSFKQKAVLLQHKDKEICRQSTAGGAFTLIAEYIIKYNGIVYGAMFDSEFNVKHMAVNNCNDLYKFRNSKYVQSSLGDTYQLVKEELLNDRLVCFSGTPCQIEGLRGFLSKEYKNLVLVDVVCRAVPSPGVWRRYLAAKREKYGNIKEIRFRDKTLGYQYSTMVMETDNGVLFRDGIESHPWLRMFFSGMIIRPSCTKCCFRDSKRISDFTIWDCFNSYQVDKSFDEDIGTTKMLIHSEKGERIWNEIKEACKYKEVSPEIIIKGVREMSSSPIVNERKKEFFEDYENMDMEILINKYFPCTWKVKFKKYMRHILNRIGLDKTVKHIKNLL